MTTPDTPVDDADVAAAQAPSIARFAGIALFCAGLFAALVGLQALTSLRFSTWLFALPVVLAAGGVAAIVVGVLVLKARAAVVGLVLAVVLALTNAVWIVGALAGGVLSPMAFLSMFFQLGALTLTPFSIGPCRRASAARERLRGADYDLGT